MRFYIKPAIKEETEDGIGFTEYGLRMTEVK